MALETTEHVADTTTNENSASEFVITRTFDAPRQLVWQAWTEAERMAQWWGPKECTIEIVTMEFRPGGILHYSMPLAENTTWWAKFVYREMSPPESLIFDVSFADENANTVRAPFNVNFPLETRNHLVLEESDGKTVLTLRAWPINATSEEHDAFQGLRASMQEGFGGTFGKLSNFLTSNR